MAKKSVTPLDPILTQVKPLIKWFEDNPYCGTSDENKYKKQIRGLVDQVFQTGNMNLLQQLYDCVKNATLNQDIRNALLAHIKARQNQLNNQQQSSGAQRALASIGK